VDFRAYQAVAARTAAPIAADHPVIYPTLGLVNEAGEVAGKIKKIFRDRAGLSATPTGRRWPWNSAMCCGISPRSAPG
jgi:hypothetical protein